MCTGTLSSRLYGLSIPAKIEAQHVEHVQRQVSSWYHGASLRTKRVCSRPGRRPQHVCTPDPALPEVAWPRQSNGWIVNSRIEPVWRACRWFQTGSKIHPTLQGRL